MPVSPEPLSIPPFVILLGPTAVGKTRVALHLAGAVGGEIIGADSLQVFRLMDIGTAKPTPEERAMVPHHLIDVVSPDEPFHAGRYRKEALKALAGISGRGKRALVVGGTGLYIRALLKGLIPCPDVPSTLRAHLTREMSNLGEKALYERLREFDPVYARTIHPNDRYRILRALEIITLTGRPLSLQHKEHKALNIKLRALKIGLYLPREELYAKIDMRCEQMIEQGLLEEVTHIFSLGYAKDLKPMQALGYKQMTAVLSGEMDPDRALSNMQQETRRYAKRQMTWFRKDPEIHWFLPDEEKNIYNLVKEFYNNPDSEIGGER